MKEIFRRPATPFVAEFVGMAKVLFATFQENQSLFTEQEAS